MKTKALRIFCIVAACIAFLVLFCSILTIWITSTMRAKYGPNLSAFSSIKLYLQEHWLDANVEPRTLPNNSPIAPTQIVPATYANRVLVGRNVVSVEPVVLPCELTNGGLPLITLRFPNGSPIRVVLDTASDYLLLADKNSCKKCSVHIYGGGVSDVDQNDAPHYKVYFGSQIDNVQFQTRSIQLSDFTTIDNVPVGMVKSRQTRIKNNSHTFNIMGIGAIHMKSGKWGLSIIERLLKHYDQPRVFGFYFGVDLKEGLFVLGFAEKKAPPVLTLPLYPHPHKPYYLLKISAIELVPHADLAQDPVIINNISNTLPEALVDTGANFMALPSSLKRYFHHKKSVHELYFYFETPHGLRSIRINHSRLYNRRGRKLFYFAPDRCVIGTLVLSLFSFVEFDFESQPTLRFWI